MPAQLEQVTSRTYTAPWPTYSYAWQVVCRDCLVALNSGHQYSADKLDHALHLANEHNRDNHHDTQRRLATQNSSPKETPDA